MQLPDWGEPRTPVKSRSHNTGHDDLKMILSQQKPKGRDLFQEIYEETLQPDMALFSGAKNEAFEEVEEGEQSQEDDEPSEKESSQSDKPQEKWQTVRKPFESANEEKHRHGQSSTARTLKGCNCDKSKCQKNYCICFKMGNVCSDDCECLECQNTHITSTLLENERLSLEFLSNQNKGCNCKSSNCMKNYCICHQMGRKCSDMCRCQNCLNFDLKDRDFDGMSGKKKVKVSEFSLNEKENIRINW